MFGCVLTCMYTCIHACQLSCMSLVRSRTPVHAHECVHMHARKTLTYQSQAPDSNLLCVCVCTHLREFAYAYAACHWMHLLIHQKQKIICLPLYIFLWDELFCRISGVLAGFVLWKVSMLLFVFLSINTIVNHSMRKTYCTGQGQPWHDWSITEAWVTHHSLMTDSWLKHDWSMTDSSLHWPTLTRHAWCIMLPGHPPVGIGGWI